MNRKRKDISTQLTVRFVPLPPARQQQYQHAFDLLAEMLFAELEKQQNLERSPAPEQIIPQPANTWLTHEPQRTE